MIAREKSRRTAPPKKNKQRIEMSVTVLVRIVRLKSCLMIASNERADTCEAFPFERGGRHRLSNLFLDFIARVQRTAHRNVILPGLGRFLNRRISQTNRFQRIAHLSDVDRSGRTQRHQIAAAKIDAEVFLAANVKGSGAGEN